ncbi:OmpA family protein [Aurantiacibacter gilvus]|uniref:OmpA family protein n=1 Tax=Aurantiacibacter gilvus TaxID=3139141 RepID=A0ABU9IH14_9SPHN
MSKPMTMVAAGALVLSLAACDVRRAGEGEGDPPVEEPDPTAEPSATPSATESSPAASILRDDSAIDVPLVEEPTEPVDLTIPFASGSDISPAAERLLEQLLREDALAEDWPVILAGHTDSGGNDQANLRSSRARAEAVAAWLVERGVADSRIRVIAFGEQNPIAPNALPDGTPNESGRRANRRVEVRIAPPPADDDDRAGFDQGA